MSWLLGAVLVQRSELAESSTFEVELGDIVSARLVGSIATQFPVLPLIVYCCVLTTLVTLTGFATTSAVSRVGEKVPFNGPTPAKTVLPGFPERHMSCT